MDTIDLARKVRIHCLHMVNSGRSSHIGSALSVVDILAVLYGRILRHFPQNPRLLDRDRFILSKGHAGAAVYATLAEVGYFPVEQLATHYQNGSYLSGHVSHRGVPGVEFSTGSLGHGLPVAAGMAYAAKLDGRHHRIFVLLSEGDCDEGSNWEAILFAAHHGLDNLVALVDYNKIQSLGPTANTLALEPFGAKWKSFNWAVREIDGHDHEDIFGTLSEIPFQKGRPNVVIAHTVKGKGVSFMENKVLWHYRTPIGEEFTSALEELTRK